MIKFLLQSTIAQEAQSIGLNERLDFWDTGTRLPTGKEWTASPPPTLDTLLGRLDEEELLRHDDETRLLCAIGWEFMWGKGRPPKQVEEQKALARENALAGKSLSELEIMLLSISAVDTDMF